VTVHAMHASIVKQARHFLQRTSLNVEGRTLFLEERKRQIQKLLEDQRSENAVKSFKQGKMAREKLRNNKISSGSYLAKETAILSFNIGAIDDQESEELAMEAFDQVDYEMEGSFVNKADDLDKDDSDYSCTVISPGLELVASTLQSWLCTSICIG
jgi:hypothetical protein